MIKSRDDYYDQRIKRHQEGADYHAQKQEEGNSQNTDYSKKKEEYHRGMINKLSAQKAGLTEEEYRKIKDKGEKLTPENYQQKLTVHGDLKTHGKATPGGGMGTILPMSEVSDSTLHEFKDDDVCKTCKGLYKDHPNKHVFVKAYGLRVGDRVIEKDHHGDTGTIKAIFPEEGSTKMYCKVQWDHGATADYFLDDMEPVLEEGQQELTEIKSFEMIYKDDDVCEVCGDCFHEHLDKNKFKLKKDIAAMTTTMAAPIA